jgi:hypothetical protein
MISKRAEQARVLYRYDKYSMVECLIEGHSVHHLRYLIKSDDDVLLETNYHDIAMQFLQDLTDRV